MNTYLMFIPQKGYSSGATREIPATGSLERVTGDLPARQSREIHEIPMKDEFRGETYMIYMNFP